MPTYNEQPARVMAGLQAIWELLRETGAADAFDLFILSDTTDAEIWIAEEAGFLALRDSTGEPRAYLLPPASEECRTQVGQHCGVGDALRAAHTRSS